MMQLFSRLGYLFCALLLALTTHVHALFVDGFAIRYHEGDLHVLDQQKLPQEEEWISITTPEEMVGVIRSLKVRGAPMIGIAAVFSLAQLAEKGASREELEEAAHLLRQSRPTAVNLAMYLDRVLWAMQTREDVCAAVIATAEAIYREDKELCLQMSELGAALIEPGERILTICNTGSLTTAGLGTALGVIKTAHAQGKEIHVYVCETRPLLQGGRLTSWEMGQQGISYTLICDSMAATLMRQGKIDRVLVGADRIARNGDFANKIGTYGLAVLAYHHRIPFHVVAPYTTVDLLCLCGEEIKIEERSSQEVRGFGSMTWSPKEAPVYNPAFDVTPAYLVTSYILDTGVLEPEVIAEVRGSCDLIAQESVDSAREEDFSVLDQVAPIDN